MRCPECKRDTVQYVIDAYVVYDAVSDDGAYTVGVPRVETFDNSFLECAQCWWKMEKVDVQIVDQALHDEVM